MLYNLREIHTPTDLAEAVRLLRRKDVRTVALAGGTQLVGQDRPDVEAVVRLDGLGLDGIERYGHVLRLGAMARLETMATDLGEVAGGLLSDAARRTAVWQVRNAATLGGTLCTADSAAPLVVVMSALGARVYVLADDQEPFRIELPQFILGRGSLLDEGALLTAIDLRLAGEEVGFGYAQVARTPADDPIVSAAARVEKGTAEVFVGGVDVTVRSCGVQGDDPGALVGRLGTKARDSIQNPPDDFLGSAEYRREMAGTLARRALVDAYARIGVEVG